MYIIKVLDMVLTRVVTVEPGIAGVDIVLREQEKYQK